MTIADTELIVAKMAILDAESEAADATTCTSVVIWVSSLREPLSGTSIHCFEGFPQNQLIWIIHMDKCYAMVTKAR